MKRRSLIQGAAAAALGVPHLSGLAQQSVTLKFHTFMAPLSNVWLTMHKPWMDRCGSAWPRACRGSRKIRAAAGTRGRRPP